MTKTTECQGPHNWTPLGDDMRYCIDCGQIASTPVAMSQQEFMRLRDKFAMAALTGTIDSYGATEESLANCAKHAYAAADAMLKERVQP